MNRFRWLAPGKFVLEDPGAMVFYGHAKFVLHLATNNGSVGAGL